MSSVSERSYFERFTMLFSIMEAAVPKDCFLIELSLESDWLEFGLFCLFRSQPNICRNESNQKVTKTFEPCPIEMRREMEKSRYVRVIERKEIRGDDPVKYFLHTGVRSAF